MDVFGFSRGTAAARHFVGRRSPEFFPALSSLGGALGVEADAIVINFVGLYDSVSSYGGEKHKTLLGQILNNKLHKSFDDNVAELRLAIGGGAAQVVQFAAADEYRENFASTNIRSSVRAGRGLEVRLPGVHSDIGGSYVERDPANPTHDPARPIRALNQESRRVASSAERQRLVEEGWYTPAQFEDPNPALRGEGVDLSGSPEPSVPQLTGVRYLTNEYQYVTLRIVHRFAVGQHGGAHEPMELENFEEDRFTTYQVPAELEGVAQHLESETKSKGRAPAVRDDATYRNGTPPTEITCRSLAERNWLRNRYLHRSAKQKGDFEPLGMEARKDDLRLVIPDDDLAYRPPSLRPKSAPTAEAVTG